jgi:ADP-heptose:LPS heptosyltransferase
MMDSRLAKPDRILIVALDNLGDLVFASALIPPLRDAFPHATIDLWSKTYTAPIARLVPHISTVFDAEPFWAVRPGSPRPPMMQVVRAIRSIRACRHDVAILSGAPWRTSAAVAATRIPMRIGLSRHRNRFFLTHALPPEDKHQPVLREQARLLEPLGVRSENPRYALDTTPLAAARAELARVLPDQFVALHPFASSRDRCVPLAEWSQVAFALAAQRIPVLWIGTAEDLGELRRITLPRGFYIDQVGEGSLSTAAAALSLAARFAGHDSGPLHVAGAFGVPVVGVFAPGEPDRTFPQGIGPSRMIAAPSPARIHAADILRDLEALQVASAT